MVSILLPFLNAASWLEECLSSIQIQSLSEWECIMVDDGSSDEGPAIAQRFADKDSRFRLLAHTGKGPDLIAAQRRAIQEAKGQFVTRMDADDRMHPFKLEALLKGQINGPCLSAGKVEFFGQQVGPGTRNYQNWLNERVEQNDFIAQLFKECPVANPCWMLNRKLASDLFESLQYPEDYDFVFRVVQEGYPIVSCPDALHYWREHPHRLSKTDLYSTERFTALKWSHFQRMHPDSRLWLLGHGKKAKYLRSMIPSDAFCGWLTERPGAQGNRLDKDRLILADHAPIEPGDAVISTLSSLEDWSALHQQLTEKGARIFPWA